MSSTYGIAYVRPGLTMSWYAPKRVFTPTEFAGIVLNPNARVNNVIAIPAQAITPRSSRNGLIGRCSATSGLGIRALLLTQRCHSNASFHSGGGRLTRCLRPSKLTHENSKHDLVSGPRSCDVHKHGGNRISNATRSW